MVTAFRHAAAFSPAQLFDVWEAVLTGATRDSRQHALADPGDIGQFVDAARRRRGTPCVRRGRSHCYGLVAVSHQQIFNVNSST
jgi:hypothetical protein